MSTRMRKTCAAAPLMSRPGTAEPIGRKRNLLVGTLAAALGVATVAAIRSAQRSPRVARAIPPREFAASFAEKTALVEGVRMRWLEHGHGQPVVFVHGIPTSPKLRKAS